VKYVSVYARVRSPFWWIAYWDPKQQKRLYKPTPFRKDVVQGKRKALDLANELCRDAQVDKEENGADRWENWVDHFLEQRYSGPTRRKSLIRMRGAWTQWRAFLDQRKIRVPRALTYNDVLAFIDWRSSQIKQVSKKQVSKNTALTDSKCMSVAMREAVHRGFCQGNPLDHIGIPRDPPAEKPEITDEELVKIREALKSRPEWMSVCFEIAIHQGCRLSETAMPLDRVDLGKGTIQFYGKGRNGKPHVFTTRLHPGLRPIIEKLRASGRKVTCDLPEMAGKEWHFFFKRIELPHLMFHCTRVTVITRMARAGVPISQAMAYVGHASELIHKIYQRLRPADTGAAVEALAGLSTGQ